MCPFISYRTRNLHLSATESVGPVGSTEEKQQRHGLGGMDLLGIYWPLSSTPNRIRIWILLKTSRWHTCLLNLRSDFLDDKIYKVLKWLKHPLKVFLTGYEFKYQDKMPSSIQLTADEARDIMWTKHSAGKKKKNHTGPVLLLFFWM